MVYFVTLLEGIISFISPCMLPMLPVYISYLAGGENHGQGERDSSRRGTITKAIAFVLGFTIVFGMLGMFAGAVGALLNNYSVLLNIICGICVIVFGLSYLGIIPMHFLKGLNSSGQIGNVMGAFLFGMIYSLNLTPCVGAFLGSALMMAASGGGAVKGFMLLLVYSLGMGIPFIISAILIGELESTFSFIKRHYNIINRLCGAFLVIIGIIIALGGMNSFMAFWTVGQ